MSLTQKVTAGVLWLTLAQVAQRLSGLVITAVLARLLSPEDFGLIALAVIAIGFIKIFSEVGLNSALIQRREVKEGHLTAAFWMTLALSLLLTVVGAAASPALAKAYGEPRLVTLLIVLLLSVPLNNLGQTSDALLQRRLAFRQLAIIDWASSLVAGLTGVALALAGAGVWALVAQNLLLVGVSSVVKMIAAGWLPRLDFQFKYGREILSFSASVLGCAVVNYAVWNVDNAVVGGALGAQALGYYSMAFGLVMLPSLSISGLIMRVMFPALSSIQDDLARLRRGYLRMLRVLSSVTLPVTVGLGVTAPLLVRVVYGDKWAPAVPVLQVLVVIGILQSVNTSGLIFYALGRPNLMLAWAVVSFVCMTLGFSFGVRWGLVGVAWAYVIVSPIVWLGPHFIANRLIGLPTAKFVLAISPAACACAVMGTAVAYLVGRESYPLRSAWANLAFLVLTGATLYVVSYVAMGTFFSRRRGGLQAWLTGRHLAQAEEQVPAA